MTCSPLFPSGKSILEWQWEEIDKSIKVKMYVLFKKLLGGSGFLRCWFSFVL